MDTSAALVFDPRRNGWLSFGDPAHVVSCTRVDDVKEVIRQAQRVAVDRGEWSVGWLSYEAAPAFDSALEVQGHSDIPLAWFGFYKQPTFLDHLPHPSTAYQAQWRAGIDQTGYAQAFASVHDHIARGDTYQVNLSFRLHAGRIDDPYSLFYSMVSKQAGPYSFFIDTGRFAVCSASPELFFECIGREIICKPMKGTAKRSGVTESDRSQIHHLNSSPKEQAENVMIVDMVRNDLSRIACDRSVQVASLCEVQSFPGVFQMVSEVRATTQSDLSEILSAMFPCASITGAPKASTMQIVKICENSPRGLYTGSLGIITPENRSWFNVAIRTAVVDRELQTAEYGVGSGVVWDSKCDQEYNECLLKAHVVNGENIRPGLFETILWDEIRGYWLLDHHLERLSKSAAHFGYPYDEEQLRCRLVSALESSGKGSDPLRVKVVLDSQGSLAIEMRPAPQIDREYRVALARSSISSNDPRLFHKTTDRSLYESAIATVEGVDDVLLWNERGEITESRIANVVVSLGGRLYTPPVSSGLLPGCLRRELLRVGEVAERPITIAELQRADAVYLANSLRGVWAVQLQHESRSDVADCPLQLLLDTGCGTNC
ncbi:MAG: chorismate-binding protein [Pseudomonadota bacterium]|jgi:para-aminobenzoate synthetase/4-amino-4-deoxychorismate lyase